MPFLDDGIHVVASHYALKPAQPERDGRKAKQLRFIEF
jgi:hypothetical protein